jgi:hypothetical protein
MTDCCRIISTSTTKKNFRSSVLGSALLLDDQYEIRLCASNRCCNIVRDLYISEFYNFNSSLLHQLINICKMASCRTSENVSTTTPCTAYKKDYVDVVTVTTGIYISTLISLTY